MYSSLWRRNVGDSVIRIYRMHQMRYYIYYLVFSRTVGNQGVPVEPDTTWPAGGRSLVKVRGSTAVRAQVVGHLYGSRMTRASESEPPSRLLPVSARAQETTWSPSWATCQIRLRLANISKRCYDYITPTRRALRSRRGPGNK